MEYVGIPTWLLTTIGFVITTGFAVIGYLLQSIKKAESQRDAIIETKLDEVLKGISDLGLRLTKLEANTDNWKEQQNLNTLKIANFEKWLSKASTKLEIILEWKKQSEQK